MVTLEQIGMRLREAIKLSGLSQKEIAQRLDVSQSCISHYMKGNIMPSLDTFANLCVILDADPTYILGIGDGTRMQIKQ